MLFYAFSVQFSHSVLPDSLWLQHTRLPCLSQTPRVYSNSSPLNDYHPTISSSVVPFSTHLQSFPASGSFPMSQFFSSGGQRIGVSASTSAFQWIFRTDFLYDRLVGFLAVQGTLKNLLQHHSSKASIILLSAFFIVQLSHPYRPILNK